tara:strand:+ start:16591 stop:18606 length:2016 start_codon:yes stop_codon:yes gene_type:complete
MIDPTYEDIVTVGGTNSSYQFGAFPNPTQSIGGTKGLLSQQSLILALTFQTAAAAQYDVSGATATLYVTANQDPDYTPVSLGSGALSDSGAGGGGTTDKVTFTVAKNQIPDDLGAYGKTSQGNAKFYVIMSDADTYLEFYEGVNVYDTQFGGTGGSAPNANVVRKNNLGVVIDTLNTPPVSPSTNDAYLVDTSPTGAWLSPTDLSDNLVIYNGGAWVATIPQEGDFLFDKDEDVQRRYDGSAWGTEDGSPFADNSALVKNSADNTKLAIFDASSITTGTTRTITIPDKNGTLMTEVSEDTTPQLGGFLDAQDNRISSLLGVGHKASTTLTIATGAVTQTQAVHAIANQSAAATDDLDSIVPATGQTELLLTMSASGQVPTIKHAAGTNTFLLPSDTDIEMVMNTIYHFHHDGTNWKLVGSSATGGGGSGQTLGTVAVAALEIDFSAGNTFTKSISTNSTFTFANETNGYEALLIVTSSSAAELTLPASVTVLSGSFVVDVVNYITVWVANTSTTQYAIITQEGAGSGVVAQVVSTQTSTYASTTTAIPDDDTIPQITEGGSCGIDTAITPTSASNDLIIQVSGWIHGAGYAACIALFVDSTADAIAAQQFYVSTGGGAFCLMFKVAASSTSARTYKARFGQTGGTSNWLGSGGAKLGAARSGNMTVWEVQP